MIGEEVIELAPPLKWYQYLWIGLPLILVFVGGGLGGVIGVIAASSNGWVFRSNRSTAAKYILSALISIAAVIVYLIVSTTVRLLIMGDGGS